MHVALDWVLVPHTCRFSEHVTSSVWLENTFITKISKG
jgi:hypothetical protein